MVLLSLTEVVCEGKVREVKEVKYAVKELSKILLSNAVLFDISE